MKKKLFAFLSSLSLCLFISCSSSDDGGNGSGGSDDDGGMGTVDRSANLLGTGDSANDILSNTNFDRLLIEAAYVQGFRPTDAAMANFVTFLEDRTFKTEIEIEYVELPSPDEEDLTLQEIADLEEENRTAYNDGSTLAIYIYFADAPSEDDDMDEGLVTLGAVYRNTSMVIFERTIRSLAGRSTLITNTDVETATLNHEFGHLFGLVNLGTVAVNDHEDEDAANHCNVEGCLMRAELQFTTNSTINSKVAVDGLQSACSLNGKTVLKMLQTNSSRAMAEVPGLDAECILDLQNNGGQ